MGNMKNKTIHGYELQYLLGEGGMAEVWYAENSIGNPVAVKVLKEEFTKMKQVVNRFENEAKVMVKLDHPNIRKVTGYGTIDDRPCIIMEYMEGKDLSVRMNKGERFDTNQLKKWWNLLAGTLAYTKDRGIIHRDIKPSNIFLTNKGEIKLLDFGISKIKDSIDETKTGSRLGTLMYMSPEQVIDGKNMDYRSDVYALAVTFYHLLTGVEPYNKNMPNFEIESKIVKEPLSLKQLPKEWVSMLAPCLEKKPENRPDLKCFILQTPKPEPDPSKRTQTNKKWLFFLLGVILAFIVGAYFFDIFKQSEPSAYQHAIRSNTMDGYADYLKKYSKFAYSNDIINRYADLLYVKNRKHSETEYRQITEWLTVFAQKDNAPAINALGYIYRWGFGLPAKSDSIAIEWYKKSAKLDDIIGQNSLGFMYRQRGPYKNDTLALYWYGKAAVQGDAAGQNSLGFLYKRGEPIKSDSLAFYWYSQAAQSGNAEGQYNVGFMYETVFNNPKEAIRWYTKAADKGYTEAKNRLEALLKK